MKRISHTLVSDGTTDANLIPIIDWTLKRVAGVDISEGTHADFWRLPKKPDGLADKIIMAVALHPCDVVFVHRDAEKEPRNKRIEEIDAALHEAGHRIQLPAVAVVPVRMLEAWLLFDERAIRTAAGNPNGRMPLNLPAMKSAESRPNPKMDLKDALMTASGHAGRRLKKFNTKAAFWRIVDFMEDFSPLLQLPAFRAFEDSVRLMDRNDWKAGFYH